ncbi:hypothetical protein [Kamptonema formosum]|uniref:hypothetical protein n=1 Tax=Kamptonema formosum TaxID=331992 RepID=UPI00034B378D|nr:hypothetical protein [Oscillatoria sp. PCC 10802]
MSSYKFISCFAANFIPGIDPDESNYLTAFNPSPASLHSCDTSPPPVTSSHPTATPQSAGETEPRSAL